MVKQLKVLNTNPGLSVRGSLYFAEMTSPTEQEVLQKWSSETRAGNPIKLADVYSLCKDIISVRSAGEFTELEAPIDAEYDYLLIRPETVETEPKTEGIWIHSVERTVNPNESGNDIINSSFLIEKTLFPKGRSRFALYTPIVPTYSVLIASTIGDENALYPIHLEPQQLSTLFRVVRTAFMHTVLSEQLST